MFRTIMSSIKLILGRLGRRRRHPSARYLALFCMLAGMTNQAHAQNISDRHPVTLGDHAEVFLPVIGGRGGGQFTARCAAGASLLGFELRTGDVVDAIAPICGYAFAPREAYILGTDSGAGQGQPGSLVGNLILEPDWHGGSGGGRRRLLCPASTPVLLRIDATAEGGDTLVIRHLDLFCGLAAAVQASADYPSAVFDGNKYVPEGRTLGIGVGGMPSSHDDGSERCPEGQVAIGMHGRSGDYLDAMGLICDAPTVWQLTAGVRSIGRVNVPSGTSNSPPVSICDAARAARARNSPAAPNLENQCQASGGGPVRSIGRVIVSPGPGNSPPGSICDAARAARARNSPAAPNLEAQCVAAGATPSPVPAPDPGADP